MGVTTRGGGEKNPLGSHGFWWFSTGYHGIPILHFFARANSTLTFNIFPESRSSTHMLGRGYGELYQTAKTPL